MGVDYIDESEVLTPADEFHLRKIDLLYRLFVVAVIWVKHDVLAKVQRCYVLKENLEQ